jgi:hypothetical protein
MTLAQFAIAVGAHPKWVQNAAALLELDLGYTADEARRLGLVKLLHEELGLTLGRSWDIAVRALEIGGVEATAFGTPDGVVRLLVDVERYLSDFAARLSLARTHYEPRPRGRPPRRRARTAVERARRHGLDIGLLRDSLRLTPAERLRRLDTNREFVRALGRARRR